MRKFAEEHATQVTSELVPRTGDSGADRQQLQQKAGSPAALGTLSAAQRDMLSSRLQEALGKHDVFEPSAVQTLVDRWLHLEKAYGWNADNIEIIAKATGRATTLLDLRTGKIDFSTSPADEPAMQRRLALQIMTHGSLNMSRTVRYAKPFTRVGIGDKQPADVNRIAAENFARAATLVADNATSLPLSFETAAKLNYMLTRSVIPRGAGMLNNPNRPPAAVYQWLQTEEARALLAKDPVGVAESVHHELSKADEFTDGNGRTARLMADLVLLKAGRAPAYYTDIENYFARGSCRANVSRESQRNHFRHIAARGQALVQRAKASYQATTSPPRA